MLRAARHHGIDLPDPQLCCAPLASEEGKRYLGAMYAAANFAFGNRQLITHWVRQSLQEVFQKGPRDLGSASSTTSATTSPSSRRNRVGGRERRLCVHRKGAPRAFPPGHPPDARPPTRRSASRSSSRRHGAVLVRPGRDRAGLGGNVRLDLPRRRTKDEPRRGQEERPRPLAGAEGWRPGGWWSAPAGTPPSRRRFPRPTRTSPTSSTFVHRAGISQPRRQAGADRRHQRIAPPSPGHGAGLALRGTPSRAGTAPARRAGGGRAPALSRAPAPHKPWGPAPARRPRNASPRSAPGHRCSRRSCSDRR